MTVRYGAQKCLESMFEDKFRLLPLSKGARGNFTCENQIYY